MFAPPHLNAALPGTIRLGAMRIPVYGLFATAGLLAALGFSQRCARRAGISRDALWDAGMLGVGAAFVFSRVLLIAANWATFRAFPMLVLTVPSLTDSGVALTLVATLVYLRLRHIPVLRALDAWAPCACLLAAFLQLGHFFEGTDAGMPTTLPWGVVAPGDTVLGRTHPVQLYEVAIALALLVWLYHRLPQSVVPGRTAALALTLGGAASFALDMLRQPMTDVLPGTTTVLPLDGSQLAAVLAMLAGVALLAFAPATTSTRSATSAPPHLVQETR